MKNSWKRIDPIGLILPVLLLSGWHVASESGAIPPYLLPSPKSVFKVMADFASGIAKLTPYSGKLLENLTASLLRVITGFGIALFFGVLMGFLTGRIGIVKRIIDPLVHAIRIVPGISWLPIAMIWFGIGELTTIFLISLAAFFPIYINTAYGASEVPCLLIRAARMLGANKTELFKTVILPSAFPSVVVGARLGLGVSWAYLVLGELTGVSEGLGAVMMDSRMLGQIEMIIVSMVCIATMGVLTDRLLLRICRSILPYQGGERK
ncbi:MAG: ABC transporter permease [Epulopiscium sp.]|nr:ABC transporter permease [Candidatus Epulonipiscium sp.]